MDESRELGFTAVHLTLPTIDDLDLVAALKERAEQLELEVVLGVHTMEELNQALSLHATMIGINNRSIKDLEVDGGTVSHTEHLAPLVPRGVLLISESSMLSPDEVSRAWIAGADAVLVGTAFAKSADLTSTLKAFLNAHLAPAIHEQI
ncbi:hypothetical protein AWV80_10950 [Cupriavidus sp. UYMU48A]|nr:hypothetical protein AWV80_10950 [Cupriavidus sp. UYMU48A]RWA56058.1 hypothetical protein AU476_04785 [Cupriavidus sp. UYMSc13B]